MVMVQALPSASSASRMFVRVLILMNLLAGAGIAMLFIASMLAESWVIEALGTDAQRIQWGRLVMVIGIGSIALVHVVLTRLLAIVETVRLGDPFVVENASRLKMAAWALLGLEVLHLAGGGAVANALPDAAAEFDWVSSATRWLAILLAFVLAQVFDDGARMRDDLRGTV